MSEFKSARGHTFVVGKNMWAGVDDHGSFSWNDPLTGDWEPRVDNEAGYIRLPIDVSPDIEVRQIDEDHIRLGEIFEIRYVGAPFIYGVFALGDDKSSKAA